MVNIVTKDIAHLPFLIQQLYVTELKSIPIMIPIIAAAAASDAVKAPIVTRVSVQRRILMSIRFATVAIQDHITIPITAAVST